MGNASSLIANIHSFFTVIVSGRSVYVGSAFSIFLASIIAPFLADVILGTIDVALSRKGFVHVAFLANVGPFSVVKDLFRVTPAGRNKAHFGVGFTVLILAIIIAAVPAVVHQLLVPSSNPPIATVWPLNARPGELKAFSERFGKTRDKVEWCVPKDGPTQTVANSLGSVVAKFSANLDCTERLDQKLEFPALRQGVTPSNLMAGLQSSTMTTLSRLSSSGGNALGIDVPLSRKTDIKYAVASYYVAMLGLSTSPPKKSCDGAVTTVVTISNTGKTPTAAEIACTAYGVNMHVNTTWEFILCYDHGKDRAFSADRTVAIFVSKASHEAGAVWDFVYNAHTPTTLDFRLLADWEGQTFSLPPEATASDTIKMEEMQIVEKRVDNITVREFIGLGECRDFENKAGLANDPAADYFVLGSWQQSGNIVHTSYSQYESTARDKILIEFTGWQGIVFMSLFLLALLVTFILQPSMRNLQLQISCSNSLALTSARSKPWYTKTGFFVRENAQGDKFVSCEEASAGSNRLTFNQAARSCKESEKLAGYRANSRMKGSQPYHSL
ncbi:hypothetical protein HDU78_007433 [Chytriomyces hyalinus]|nr:hypothetical protein HDU78_007433 [Chytriomyces hyalinus]